MRKMLLIMMALLLIPALCCCTGDPDPTLTTQTPAPSGTSDDREFRYNVVMDQLALFVGDADGPVTMGIEQVSYLMGELADLGQYKDCQQILSRFSVISQANLGAEIVYTQRNGKQTTETYASYEYLPDGTMIEGYGPENLRLYGIDAPLQYEYDEGGRVAVLRCEDPAATLIPTYDEAGNMISIAAQFADATYTNTYSYDEAGNLLGSTVYSPDGSYRTYANTYDEQGRLSRCVSTPSGQEDTYISDYNYLHEILYRESTACIPYGKSEPAYTIRTDVQLDDRGNIARISRSADSPSYPYALESIVYRYENLYFYTP